MDDLKQTVKTIIRSATEDLGTNPLWTIDDAANYLRLKPETVRSMARRGEIPGIKVGKVWRFLKRDLQELLSKK